MSTESSFRGPPPLPEDLRFLSGHWLLFLILGIAVIVVGTLAIIFSFIATLATVAMFGMLLLLGGVMHLVNAITGRGWRDVSAYAVQ